ncbi:hypothetical protein MRB53_009237 [Persea americana]|uniref:Uncharacterized protein n=1 Tax=Persea americana TaxID=3435 RepID=A0ACC2LNU1_PERAE|nr:hypothetical protein MRB53_009237 [Persea americana]
MSSKPIPPPLPPPPTTTSQYVGYGKSHISHEKCPQTPSIFPSWNYRFLPEGWTDQGTKDELFEQAVQEDWEAVISIYKDKGDIAWTPKITRNKETALHIAISDSKTEVVKVLLLIIDPFKIREMLNDMDENPLHLAASLGQAETCKQLVEKDPEMIGARNKEGETPLFQAALYGKKAAFYALHPRCPITGKHIKHDIVHCKRTDGNSILHVAIQREYFGLAYQIICWYPELIKFNNEKKQTALHSLAQNPSAFRSGCHLGLFDDFIYRCLIVDLDEEVETASDYKDEHCLDSYLPVPRNYQTFLDLLKLWKNIFTAIAKWAPKWEDVCKIFNKDVEKHQLPVRSTGKDKKQAPEDPSQDKKCEHSHIDIKVVLEGDANVEVEVQYENIPCSECLSACHIPAECPFAANPGILRTPLATIVEASSISRDDDNKSTAAEGIAATDAEGLGYFQVCEIKVKKQKHKLACQIMKKLVHNIGFWVYVGSGSAPVTVDSSIVADSLLIEPPVDSSKHSTVEYKHLTDKEMKETKRQSKDKDKEKMVKDIISALPGKEVLLEAEKTRPDVYRLKILENDSQEDGDNPYWSPVLIAVKMGYIKSSTPTNLWTVRNREGKTSMEVFEETHEGMIKDGVQWLNSTSESCSVVAALIASVAYASATNVPGGDNQNNGIPILKGEPSLDTFIIASLVALCFSVTFLTMFLSVLTSNYTIQDFLHNLPTKLLLGLTSLFISIGAMLVSFCAGHFFNIGDQNRNTGLPVFAIICLPVSAYVLTHFRLLLSLLKAPF